MKRKSLTAVMFLLVITAVSACGKSEPAAPKEVVLSSFQTKDGKVSISAPESWTVRESGNEDVILAIEESTEDMDAIMFSDVLDGETASEYLIGHLEEFKQSSEEAVYSNPAPITVNGINAFYSEYSEKTEDGTEKYLIAAYDVNGTVYEILVSTSEENYGKNKKAMMDLINSLKAI